MLLPQKPIHPSEAHYFESSTTRDLDKIIEDLRPALSNKKVLELGAGTGFWTSIIAQLADSVTATDININHLKEANKRASDKKNVSYTFGNFYKLEKLEDKFDCIFAAGVWSIIPLEKLEEVLVEWKKYLNEKGTFIFLDRRLIRGISNPIYKMDRHGNTFEKSQSEQGSVHLSLRNYPTPNIISEYFGRQSRSFDYEEYNYFWRLQSDVY